MGNKLTLFVTVFSPAKERDVAMVFTGARHFRH